MNGGFGNNFDRNEEVYVTVTADDGSDTNSMDSSSVTVSNTAPTASAATITPSAPMAQADDLVCSATGDDDDGDSVNFFYEWQEDGVTTSYTGDTVPASETEDGEVWTCTLTPDDGTDSGTSISVSVTIDNNFEGAEGSELCAAAGTATNSSYSMDFCLSPTSLTLDASNSAWTVQGSSNVIFTPSN